MKPVAKTPKLTWTLALVLAFGLAPRLFITTAIAQCVFPPAGLISWWAGEGNADDVFGGHPGLLSTIGVTYAPGKVGLAFKLDGTNGHIATRLDVQPTALSNTTWEAWIYPTGLSSSNRQVVLSADDGGFDRTVSIEANGNFGVFRGAGGGVDLLQPVAATPNEWQHIAVIYTPTSMVFYKNGTRYPLNGAPRGQATTNSLRIGALPNGAAHFQGLIDEIAIYNRALSSTEIQGISADAGKCPLAVATNALFRDDFEDTIRTNWSATSTANAPRDRRRFLGHFGSQTVNLTLDDLPAHTQLTAAFDLLVVSNWTGNLGSDRMQINVVGGPTNLVASFRNGSISVPQSYPGGYGTNDFPGWLGALETNSLGYVADSIYHLSFTFPHTSSSLKFGFSGVLSGAVGSRSWGLDNVVVFADGPAIALEQPVNGTLFTTPTNLLLRANAAATSGKLQYVQFLDNNILLGTVVGTNSPFTLTWSNVPAGFHVVTARATDDAGRTGVATAIVTGNGLVGEYYSTTNLSGPSVLRRDAAIYFDWQFGRPMSSLPVDRYSARWTGEIVPRFTTNYTFYTTANDGVRLWINGRRVIDDWRVQNPTTTNGSIFLRANQRYSVDLEYFEFAGTASLQLEWQAPGQPREIIPPSQLFPFAGGNRPPNVPVVTSFAPGEALNPTNFAMATDLFSDPDAGQAMSNADWEIYYAGSSANLVWSSERAVAPNPLVNWLTNGVFTDSPLGRLATNFNYVFRVRHRDNSGTTNAASDWSEIPFNTLPPIVEKPFATSPLRTNVFVVGDTLVLGVVAANIQPAVANRYQWQFNGRDIVGATSNLLTLRNLQPTNAGDYSVVVRNQAGSSSSSSLSLSVSYLEICGTVWDDRNASGFLDTPLLRGNHPDVVYVIDRSFSTLSPFGGDPVADINHDGQTNTILDAELAGFIVLNRALVARGYGTNTRVAVIDFGRDAAKQDMDPLADGTQLTTAPDADVNTNGVSDVEDILRSIRYTGTTGTDFHVALLAGAEVLSALGTPQGNGNLVFLSDGFPDVAPVDAYTNDVATLLNAGIYLRAFGAGLSARLNSLLLIDPEARLFTRTEQLAEFFGGPTSSVFEREHGLAGVTLYLDLNNNNQLDPGEPNTISASDDPLTPDENEAGRFCFDGLNAGTNLVRRILPPGFAPTYPSSTYAGGHFLANVHVPLVSNLNFGLALRPTLGLTSFAPGRVTLTFERSGGVNHRIEVSSDMLRWTTLTNLSGTNTTLTFTDPIPVSSGQRFYRAVQR